MVFTVVTLTAVFTMVTLAAARGAFVFTMVTFAGGRSSCVEMTVLPPVFSRARAPPERPSFPPPALAPRARPPAVVVVPPRSTAAVSAGMMSGVILAMMSVLPVIFPVLHAGTRSILARRGPAALEQGRSLPSSLSEMIDAARPPRAPAKGPGKSPPSS